MLHIGKDEVAEDDEEIHEDETPKVNEAQDNNYAELKEQMLRLAAEFDNYKKRVKKDIDNAENLGKAALIKDMLPVIDEFELAILAINDSKDKHVAKGIEMLYSNLMDTLKKEGLSEIEADGVFDPYRHEIMMAKESDEKEGTILEVVKKGYMFGDRLIRPASVIVSKKENKKDENNT